MDVVQGDLENVMLLKHTIKTSLGPNGLTKLLVDSYDGRIVQPSHHLYEKLFISLSTPQPGARQREQDEPLINDDEAAGSNYLDEDRDGERYGDRENESDNGNNENNEQQQQQQQQQQGAVGITSMVGALLRGRQYMLQSSNDGSSSVVLLGACFLEIGHRLHSEGISRHLISENFQKGLAIALKALDEVHKKKIEVNWRAREQVYSVFEMVLSNKLARREIIILSNLFATALSIAMTGTKKGDDSEGESKATQTSSLNNVHLCSCVGGDVSMSNHVSGFIIPYIPITVQNSIKGKVRVAIFAIPLQENTNKTKLKANLNTPQDLKQWQKEEEALIKETALRIVDTGANLVLAVGTIHKYILHWLDARGIVAIQSIPKNDLISISEVTGAKLIYQPSFMDSADLGTADSFDTQLISGQLFSYLSLPQVVTVIIRGPTQYKTQQLMQHCQNALAVAREMKTIMVAGEVCGTLEVIAGGGVPEMTASSVLSSLQVTDSDFLGQYIMHGFSEGFEIIPKTLLENAGAPNHNYNQLKNLYEQGERNNGITKDGQIKTLDVDVFDLLDVKKRIWSTAVDVASMLLLVDDSIVGNPLQY